MPAAIPFIIKAVAFVGGGSFVVGAIKIGLAVASQFLGSKPKKGKTGRQDLTLMVKESAYPRREIYGRARVGGIWMYAQTTGEENKTLYLVLGICEGEIDAVEEVYFGENRLIINPDGSIGGEYINKVEMTIHKGSDAQAADPTLVADLDSWTEDHKLSGIAYAVFKLTYDITTFGGGLPEISFIVRGRSDIYDPRTQTTGYSTNPALCLNHFLTSSKWGARADYASEVDEPALIAAANVCDEVVDTLNGVENRYMLNGVVSSSSSVEDNIGLMRQTMAGWVVFSGGRFRISAGAYNVPTFTITPDMILNVSKHTTKKPRRARVNLVKGLYVSEVNKWQESDFPAVTSAAYVAADGGDELPHDIELNLVQSTAQAQRLAKIELESARLERTVSLDCSLRALPVVAGATVMLDFPRYGYTGKVFQCVASEVRPGSGSTPPTISLELREWDASIYAWDFETEEQESPEAPTIPGTEPKVPPVDVELSYDGVNYTSYPSDNSTVKDDPQGLIWVKLSSANPSAAIYYTTKKNSHPIDPTATDTLYTAPFSVFESSGTLYIKVIAIEDTYQPSDVRLIDLDMRDDI